MIHADAADDAQKSVSWIRAKQSKVSYHVLIDRDGSVYRFVEPGRKAWHAGVSEYDGVPNVNDFSLGLSFANLNDGVEPYTDLQYEIGAAVVAGWMRMFPGITLDRITTHAEIAPTRKTDPGPLWDMERFKRYVQETLAGVKAA